MAEQITEGDPPGSHKPGGAPYPPRRAPELVGPLAGPEAHIPLYDVICPRKKIKKRLSGRSAAVSRQNLGRSTFVLRWSDSAGETSLRGGRSKPSPSPMLPPSWEDQNHQNLHQHHLISNPSSSLVFNLCPKTSDWYLWVASSVDYIL